MHPGDTTLHNDMLVININCIMISNIIQSTRIREIYIAFSSFFELFLLPV